MRRAVPRLLSAAALLALLALPAVAAAATDLEDVIVPIGVVGTVFGFSALMIGIVSYTAFRSRRLRHETIRLAIEKGQPLPSSLLDPQDRPDPQRDLRRGLLLVGVGAGISAFLFMVVPPEGRGAWGLGLIPGFLGFAYLVAFALSRRLGRGEADRG